MSKAIVITSGKGGVGKTTVTTHLAKGLTKLNKRVVAIDLDFGLGGLDLGFGVTDAVVYNVSDVIKGKCRVRQALIECGKNLYMLPAPDYIQNDISGQNVKVMIDGLKSHFDYVLIDCPSGIDFGFRRAISAVDGMILVVNPTYASMRDADKVLTIASQYELDSIWCVVNNVRVDLVKKKKQLSPKDIEGVLKVNVLAGIPQDDKILLADNAYLPKSSLGYGAFITFAKQFIAKI